MKGHVPTVQRPVKVAHRLSCLGVKRPMGVQEKQGYSRMPDHEVLFPTTQMTHPVT